MANRAKDRGVLMTLSQRHLVWRLDRASTSTCKWHACEHWKMAVTWCARPATGITAIIDAQGDIVERAPQFGTTSLTGEFYAMEG